MGGFESPPPARTSIAHYIEVVMTTAADVSEVRRPTDEQGHELGVNFGLGPAFGAFSDTVPRRYIWTDGIAAEL
jgi:hypothetical protein